MRPEPRRRKRWLTLVAGVVVVQALCVVAAPHLPLPPVAGFIVSFAFVGANVLAVSACAPAVSTRALGWLAAPVAMLVAAAWLSTDGGVGTVALVTAGLLLAGSLVGAAVGSRIERPSHLWIVALVASGADVFSVLSSSGPTAQIVDAPRVLALAALSWPLPGDAVPVPILGVGDVVMTSLFLVAARRHELPARRSVLALAVGYAATLGALFALERPIPALPLLSMAFVAAHPRILRLAKQDRRPLLIGAAIVALLLAAVWWVF